eukprot:Phypoly_transcript_01315.p1 GENE.Phypoly_transcript_01315~~Phypoly_transcript_01315.p1  ORF type:complete len:923 (+),score=129.07 Phypoly_transcript_01315:76-2844(+)
MANFKVDVMLSFHCGTMLNHVRDCKRFLESNGLSVFASDQILTGEQFRHSIITNAMGCQFFIAFMNEGWCKSGECNYEFNIALRGFLTKQSPIILPLLFESFTFYESYPEVNGLLCSTNAMSVNRNDLGSKTWQRILSVIDMKAGRTPITQLTVNVSQLTVQDCQQHPFNSPRGQHNYPPPMPSGAPPPAGWQHPGQQEQFLSPGTIRQQASKPYGQYLPHPYDQPPYPTPPQPPMPYGTPSNNPPNQFKPPQPAPGQMQPNYRQSPPNFRQSPPPYDHGYGQPPNFVQPYGLSQSSYEQVSYGQQNFVPYGQQQPPQNYDRYQQSQNSQIHPNYPYQSPNYPSNFPNHPPPNFPPNFPNQPPSNYPSNTLNQPPSSYPSNFPNQPPSNYPSNFPNQPPPNYLPNLAHQPSPNYQFSNSGGYPQQETTLHYSEQIYLLPPQFSHAPPAQQTSPQQKPAPEKPLLSPAAQLQEVGLAEQDARFDCGENPCETFAQLISLYNLRKCIVWKPFWFDYVIKVICNIPFWQELLSLQAYDDFDAHQGLLSYLQGPRVNDQLEQVTLRQKYSRMKMPYLVVRRVNDTIYRLTEGALSHISNNSAKVDVCDTLTECLKELDAMKNIMAKLKPDQDPSSKDYFNNFALLSSKLVEIIIPFPFAIPFISYVFPVTQARNFGYIRAVVLVVAEPGDVIVRYEGHDVANREGARSVFKLARQFSTLFFVQGDRADKETKYETFTSSKAQGINKKEWKSCRISSEFSPPVHSDLNNSPSFFIITGNNFFPLCIELEINNNLISTEYYEVLSSEMILLKNTGNLWGKDLLKKVVVRSKFSLPENQQPMSATWTGNPFASDGEALFYLRLCNIVPCDLAHPDKWKTLLDEVQPGTKLEGGRTFIATGKKTEKDPTWREMTAEAAGVMQQKSQNSSQ